MSRNTGWNRDLRSCCLASLILFCACGDDSSPLSEATARECADGMDNDGDGAIDCADRECAAFAFCVSVDASIDVGGPVDAGTMDAGMLDTNPTPTCSLSVDGSGSTFTDTCGGDEICICPLDPECVTDCELCLSPGTCGLAFPRRYRVVPLYAFVNAFKPSGETWDGDGSGPDLFAAVQVDGAGRFITATANDLTRDADDDYTAFYSGTRADFNMVLGSAVVAEVIDEDALEDDSAFMCEWFMNPTIARSRLIQCEGADLGGFAAIVLPL